jgi:tetratricopeptide (TPR) repeat protein
LANGGTSGGSSNGLLYGIIGALCVVVAGGGFYVFKMDKPVEPPVQAAIPAPAAPAAQPAPAPAPAVVAPRAAAQPAPTGPTAAQLGQARRHIADARHLASLGDFANAEVALQAADKVDPGLAEIAQARRDIAQMRTGSGQVGPLVERARHAIERGDYVIAGRALAEAEQIDARAPAVIAARRELQAAEGQANRPQEIRPQDPKVTLLVTAARAAMLVGDLASADRSLDQAEQIDPRDSAVVQARAVFNAQRAGRPLRN